MAVNFFNEWQIDWRLHFFSSVAKNIQPISITIEVSIKWYLMDKNNAAECNNMAAPVP